MHTAKCWFLNLIFLYFSFHLINVSSLVINKEYGQKHAGLLEPCIEPLCSEFSVKMRLNRTCVPGRCECPEERQFCTNKDSTRGTNPKKNKYNRTRKEYSSWIHRWIYTFPNLFIDYWLIIVTVFLFVCIHARDPRRGLYQTLLLKFIIPLIGYHSTVTTIHEVGFVGYLLIFLMCVLLPIVIGLVLISLCNNNVILFRYRQIRRRRPEPQMYDAIPRRNLENHRTMPPSPNLPQQPIQNQPPGHGRGWRRQPTTDNDVNEDVQNILSNWEPIIKEVSLVTVCALAVCTILVMIIGAPEVLQQYSTYIFVPIVFLIIMYSLVISGYYDNVGEITSYLLVPCFIFGTVCCIIVGCNRYVVPYILNLFFPDDDTPQDNVEVQQDEAHNDESPNISASSTQSLHSPPHSRGRGRKKEGKKRRR